MEKMAAAVALKTDLIVSRVRKLTMVRQYVRGGRGARDGLFEPFGPGGSDFRGIGA